MRTAYPLGETSRQRIRTGSGRPLCDLTLENLRAGALGAEDLSIHPDTLREQAAIAQEAGFPHLAANLRRAAELASIPNERVLAIYEALRPYRVTYEQLLALAEEIEASWQARETACLVRQAAEAYKERGLC